MYINSLNIIFPNIKKFYNYSSLNNFGRKNKAEAGDSFSSSQKRKQQFITPEKKEAIKKLRAEGKKNKEIAQILGIPEYTVSNIVSVSTDIPKRNTNTPIVTEELIKKVDEARKRGEPADVTCKNLGIERHIYDSCVKKGNMPKRTQKFMTPEKKEAIKKLRAEGKSNQEIADILGIPKTSVERFVSHSPDIPKINLSKYEVTDELIEQVAQARIRGEKCEETCKRLNISEKCYYKCVTKGNLPRNHQIYITLEKKLMIKELKNKGKNNQEIADALGLPIDIVKYALAHLSAISNNSSIVTDELINEVEEGRKRGESERTTCTRLKISRDIYRACVKKGNLPRKKERYITPEKKEEIKRLRAEGKSNQEIANILEIPKHTVAVTVSTSDDIPKQTVKNYFVTDELISQVNEARKRGELARETCTRLSIPRHIYNTCVSRGNMPKRTKTIITPETKVLILQMKAEGKSHKEISDALNISKNVVVNTIYRASKKPISVIADKKTSQDVSSIVPERQEETPAESEESSEQPKKEIKKHRRIIPEWSIMLSDIEKKILEHYRNPNNGHGSATKFCEENHISPCKYTTVVHANVSVEEREKLKQQKSEIQKKKKEIQKQKDEMQKPKEEESKQSQKTILRQNSELSQIDKKILEHFRNPNNGHGSISRFCEENHISRSKYSSVVKANISAEEIEKLKQQKFRTHNSPSNPNIPTTDSSEPKSAYDLDNIFVSNIERVNTYCIQVKEEIVNIIDQPIASQGDIEEKIQALEKIKNEVSDKSSHYPNNTKEYRVLQKLISHIDISIRNVSRQMNKFIHMEGSSSLPNVTWLDVEDFENKLFSHQKILNVSILAQCEQAEINEANIKLKQAYPEECVIWIEDYDTMNTNNPNEQKYTVKGRFYESKDERRNGQFGTTKKFIIEFFSDRKHLYKNFIDTLIKNRCKVAHI